LQVKIYRPYAGVLMLTNANFPKLTLIYEGDITTDVLDFGAVTITDRESKRSFKLDIEQTFRVEKQVSCLFQNVDQMKKDRTFNGLTQFDLTEEDLYLNDLTEEDLYLNDLDVEVYCGCSPDSIKPLFGEINAITDMGVVELIVGVE